MARTFWLLIAVRQPKPPLWECVRRIGSASKDVEREAAAVPRGSRQIPARAWRARGRPHASAGFAYRYCTENESTPADRFLAVARIRHISHKIPADTSGPRVLHK